MYQSAKIVTFYGMLKNLGPVGIDLKLESSNLLQLCHFNEFDVLGIPMNERALAVGVQDG